LEREHWWIAGDICLSFCSYIIVTIHSLFNFSCVLQKMCALFWKASFLILKKGMSAIIFKK
jgi:hypothetical protein